MYIMSELMLVCDWLAVRRESCLVGGASERSCSLNEDALMFSAAGVQLLDGFNMRSSGHDVMRSHDGGRTPAGTSSERDAETIIHDPLIMTNNNICWSIIHLIKIDKVRICAETFILSQ